MTQNEADGYGGPPPWTVHREHGLFVDLLTVLGDIQPVPFLLTYDAQAQGPVDGLEDDEADDGIIDNRDTNTRRLNEQLSGIPFQRTRCTAYGMD